MKQDSYWRKSDQQKANIFAEHLVKFTPNGKEVGPEEGTAVIGRRESTQSQMTEIMKLTKCQIKTAIFKYLGEKKTPGK